MKTVTAKDFQLRQSYVMNDVAAGTAYQVTYHGKPWVELRPAVRPRARVVAGSPEAFQKSLSITLQGSGLPAAPDYKTIRRQRLRQKYGR